MPAPLPDHLAIQRADYKYRATPWVHSLKECGRKRRASGTQITDNQYQVRYLPLVNIEKPKSEGRTMNFAHQYIQLNWNQTSEGHNRINIVMTVHTS